MDLIGGLSAAKLAIDIAKDLRSIDRSVDEATYKLKLADLSSALAEAQVALSDARLRINELEAQVRDMRDGTLCPICRKGRLKAMKVTPHDWSGAEFHTFRCNCETCAYETTRTYDPTRGIYSSKNE